MLLEIVDHGRGVPDELKQQMFEPFQRLDGARRRPGAAGGLGLGLAVVRGFLDIMGGTVEARRHARRRADHARPPARRGGAAAGQRRRAGEPPSGQAQR